ncbi:DUF4097 family beta strand repeat-containing protein [Aliiglaciecola sp. LCG003]|uniref:DUF4097 family beta strand repeat-containing protein n=1 Tax=Aliiglaciecola sp. LCG003 TaxID=3053655 RepID=UPI00257394B6|nr:DUF4097 family beta strand repeat-containing protein [Aliiglaciecola sp. LCG003]WJG09449.1 hypothetical protein QR722_19310 [Aliiglaciecola sp. LCG003]
MFTQSRLLIYKLIILVVFFATFSASAEVINRTFEVDKGGELYLRTDMGRLVIETHNSNEVLLEVELKGEDADKFELSHDVNGDRIEIIGKIERKKNWGWNRDLKIEFRVTVPREFNLDMHTSGGSIHIEDLIGNIDAHTSGGSISVGKVTGDVVLKTSGGSIETESIYGELNAHTSGGSIRTTISKQPSKDAELTTSGGSIKAYLIENIQIDIDASTSGGRVRTDFDVDGKVKKQSIRGEINGGGPKLELHTSGGSVSIKKL